MITVKKSALKYKDSDGNMQDVGAIIGKNLTDSSLTQSKVAADAKVTGISIRSHTEQIQGLQRQIAVQRARMNTFESLQDGSTTGDLELADIRIDINGTTHDAAGDAVRAQIESAYDTFRNSSQITRLNDFVKRNNIVRMGDFSATNSEDGLTRNASKSIIDPAKCTLSGSFYATNESMRISEIFTLEAGKTYSVYGYSESTDINFTFHLASATNGSVYQENGVNKIIARTISSQFTTLHPETTESYAIKLYLNFEKASVNDNIYIYIIEGEYTLNDFLYVSTKNEVDLAINNTGILAGIPEGIAKNVISTMKTNNIVENHVIVRSATKCANTITVLNGNFPAYSYIAIGERFKVEANKVYTAYAVSNFTTSAGILFETTTASFLQNNGSNIKVYANGINQFIPEVDAEVQACLYSNIEQDLEDEILGLYILEGSYSMPDFCKYIEKDDIKIATANSTDLVCYKEDILSSNLLTMTSCYFNAGSAEPSAMDRSITKLNGAIVGLEISNKFELSANKTYTVCAIDNVRDDNYSVVLQDVTTNTIIQSNGVEVSFNTTNSHYIGTFTPDATATVKAVIYNKTGKTVTDRYLRVLILEGEYTYDDLVKNRNTLDTVIPNMGTLATVPKEITDNSVNIMKNINVSENGATRSNIKYTKSISVADGIFPAYTFTRIGELFTVKPNTVYTVFAVSNFRTNINIVFAYLDGAFLTKTGESISVDAASAVMLIDDGSGSTPDHILAWANGLTQFTSETGGNVQACLYSFVDQEINNETIALYIMEGAYSMEDFCSYITYEDVKDVVENLSDITCYKEGILDNNLLTMSSCYFNAASAEPSPIDRSITKLNGRLPGLSISGEFKISADKTYTVCAIDNVKDVNYSIFFYDVSTGQTIQSGGVNRGFNVTNDGYFGTFTPDVSATVKAVVYNKNRDTVTDRYLRLIVLEGEYALSDIISTIDDDSVQTFDYESYGLPILRVFGSTTGMNKETEVTLDYDFEDFGISGTLTMKWQGSSSITYPKKNYTVKFDNKFEAVSGWGSQKKYCLKANYIDFSQARNVVCAKLWGQIVKSRATKNENLYDLPNGGAIDGFPIMLVVNGVYQGLYTFNIPKDKWMMNMGSGTTEYMVTAEQHDMRTAFRQAITLEELQSEKYFAIEHASDGVENQAILDALNNLTNACINGGENYRETVEQYMDMESAIDYFIFTCLLCGGDITNKNYILVSFDGVKWVLSAYDMDSVFGNYWDGKSYNEASHTPMLVNFSNMNRLMKLIYTYDKEALKARYKELRETVMSEENVMYTFYNFIVNIPKALYDEEVKIWPRIPGTMTNNLSQIIDFYRLRVKLLDAEIESL